LKSVLKSKYEKKIKEGEIFFGFVFCCFVFLGSGFFFFFFPVFFPPPPFSG